MDKLKLKNVRSTNATVPYLSVEESAALLYLIHPDYPNLREDFRVGSDNFEME